MPSYQELFIELCLRFQVIRFGHFTLKSGRQSPYFFNAGLFNHGKALAEVGYFYALAAQQAGISYDMLFGPAYKGIPLVTSMAIALAEKFARDIPYAFNRKEAKDHGEGGTLVGHPLQGEVLIVDDVITAGTAIRESIELIRAHGARPAGIVLALDRQEKGHGHLSAVQEISREQSIPVISVIKLEDILEFLQNHADFQQFHAELAAYFARYAV